MKYIDAAPNKIYLIRQHPGPCWFKDRQLDSDVEYIRKDALLKWLDGEMTIEGATDGFIGGYDTALKDVIDRINSM